MLPPKLEEELTSLREEHDIEVHEDQNFVYLVVRGFQTSDLYQPNSTTILLQVPRPYPDAGLDMFWADEDLRLRNGNVPQAGDVIETHLARRWRRFSWHPQFGGSGKWDPNIHNIRTYLAFISRRFEHP